MNDSQAETLRYHREFYASHKLFEEGSWLSRPDQELLNLVPLLYSQKNLNILDLGAGVGRNAIPLAKMLPSSTKITCVDILDLAIEELKSNSKKYEVSENIIPVLSSVEQFEITPKTYDLIIASSVIEHAINKSKFNSVINNIKSGTKLGGINRLSITVDLTETVLETNKVLTPLIETNLALDEAIDIFREAYSEWKIIDQVIAPYEEVQDRNGVKIIWSCNYFSLIVQKIKY